MNTLAWILVAYLGLSAVWAVFRQGRAYTRTAPDTVEALIVYGLLIWVLISQVINK